MNKKVIRLSESYKFDVVVTIKQSKLAGRLELSSSKVTLTIMGEDSKDKVCPIFRERKFKQVICRETNVTFVLNNLFLVSGSSRTITNYPEHKGFFEYTYDVGHLIYVPTDVYSENCFCSISVHGGKIPEWIGRTKLQSKIIEEYEKNERYSSLLEFSTFIQGVGFLGVDYNLLMYVKDFSAGLAFPPSLHISLEESTSSENIKKEYDRILYFLSVLVGSDVEADMIEVSYSNEQFSNKSYLYYPSKADEKKLPSSSTILFPLGHDLTHDQLGLPSFPLNSFSEYFSLEASKSIFFEKYVRYRGMHNVEERFLGFFRILESLCFNKKEYLDPLLLKELSLKIEPYLVKKFNAKKDVKSFMKGLPRYNSSKYNTEKNIQDFFIKIPTDLSSDWVYGKKDISGICKLRNDITHANNYYVKEGEVECKAKFIEVLLMIQLLSLVGVPLEASCKIIKRIDGYFLIKTHTTV